MIIGIDIRNIGKQRTGDETVFFNLVKNLAQIDKENEYKLFTNITDVSIITAIKNRLEIEDKSNFEIISLPTKNKFFWNAWTLPNYLRKNPVDIYHTQYITPFFVSRKIKVVTHLHDISFKVFPRYVKKSDLFFLSMLIPMSLNRADKIFAVSEFTKKEIVGRYGIAPEKIVVAYNGLGDDFNKFADEKPNASESERVRKKYGLPEKFILYVGTLQPRKNIPALLRAYSRVKDSLAGAKIVLAGNPRAHNADSQIKAVISREKLENYVIFSGYVGQEDLPLVYEMAHVFVFPSLYEGFGIPILEAMSRKVPVLASDISVHREVAGEAAIFADPSDLDNFSRSLYAISIDEELRKRIIDSGSERARFFSWKKTAGEVLKTYHNL